MDQEECSSEYIKLADGFFMHTVYYREQLLDKVNGFKGATTQRFFGSNLTRKIHQGNDEIRKPIGELLKQGICFRWSYQCQPFDRFKEILLSPPMLTHYNPCIDVVVNVGIGTRKVHRLPDGLEKAHVYHAPRSQTPGKTRNIQIEENALDLVFVVKKISLLARLSRTGVLKNLIDLI